MKMKALALCLAVGMTHTVLAAEQPITDFKQLQTLAQSTPEEAKQVYSMDFIDLDGLAKIYPTVKMDVVSYQDGHRTVTISGYQMKGAESVIFVDKGQRSIIATLSEQGIKQAKVGPATKDDYDNEWMPISLTGKISADVLESNAPLWQYAEKLDTTYCSTCHAKVSPDRFTVNAWGPVVKSMGRRTNMSTLNLEILTKFLQSNASDVAKD